MLAGENPLRRLVTGQYSHSDEASFEPNHPKPAREVRPCLAAQVTDLVREGDTLERCTHGPRFPLAPSRQGGSNPWRIRHMWRHVSRALRLQPVPSCGVDVAAANACQVSFGKLQ